MTLLQILAAIVVMMVIKQILEKPQMAREMIRQMKVTSDQINQTAKILQGKEE